MMGPCEFCNTLSSAHISALLFVCLGPGNGPRIVARTVVWSMQAHPHPHLRYRRSADMVPPLPSPQKCSGMSSAISWPCWMSPSQVCEGSVVHGGGQVMGRG
eukprot:1553264-Pyramimonas_sp.AAC.1